MTEAIIQNGIFLFSLINLMVSVYLCGKHAGHKQADNECFARRHTRLDLIYRIKALDKKEGERNGIDL